MKCIPMNWAGRLVAAASSVMEMELVLEARRASGRQQGVELPEELDLQLQPLDDGLDGQVGAGRGVHRVGGVDPVEDPLARFWRE